MLEVLAWMVVPAAAESPFRSSIRESETSASAVFVRVSSVLMLSSGNIMASCYAHLSLSFSVAAGSLYCDVFERIMPMEGGRDHHQHLQWDRRTDRTRGQIERERCESIVLALFGRCSLHIFSK